MKLFVLLDHYLPGYRAGGPPRTLSNMVEKLGDRIDFWIFTRNHDFADTRPYPTVKTNAWNTVGRAHVYYCAPENLSARAIRKAIRDVNPDAVYLNSFFSRLTIRYLILRYLGFFSDLPCIVAPRGEFSPNALKHKGRKKALYRAAIRLAPIYRRVIWQASSTLEREHIIKAMGEKSKIYVASNIPTELAALQRSAEVQKTPGKVRLVFLSRISPTKNLHYALERLRHVTGDVLFDIYGPRENPDYWNTCETAISKLPSNIRVTYRGTISPFEVVGVLSDYHFFFFPTSGENFGHVIFEALSAGCPPIISDLTPWRDLKLTQAGWNLSLDRPDEWTETLERCVKMDETTFQLHSQAALRYAAAIRSNPEITEQNLALFSAAMTPRESEFSELAYVRN